MKMERWSGASSHLGGQGSPKHPFTVMCQPQMGDMQGRQILLQILCWLRFLIQCFSECIHSPTEIEPCALGVTIICLILNKMFGKTCKSVLVLKMLLLTYLCSSKGRVGSCRCEGDNSLEISG